MCQFQRQNISVPHEHNLETTILRVVLLELLSPTLPCNRLNIVGTNEHTNIHEILFVSQQPQTWQWCETLMSDNFNMGKV
jgi:hypothetical protein